MRWDTGYFDLTGKVTKKKLRRLVPILPAAMAWLERFRGQKGPIISEIHPERPPTAMLKQYGMAWRHNGLRDAFGSNRAAVIKNLNQVAMEMGNSPDMAVESYREVFTEQQAQRFWALKANEGRGDTDHVELNWVVMMFSDGNGLLRLQRSVAYQAHLANASEYRNHYANPEFSAMQWSAGMLKTAFPQFYRAWKERGLL